MSHTKFVSGIMANAHLHEQFSCLLFVEEFLAALCASFHYVCCLLSVCFLFSLLNTSHSALSN